MPRKETDLTEKNTAAKTAETAAAAKKAEPAAKKASGDLLFQVRQETQESEMEIASL